MGAGKKAMGGRVGRDDSWMGKKMKMGDRRGEKGLHFDFSSLVIKSYFLHLLKPKLNRCTNY